MKTLSVAMATRNEEKNLKRCLRSVKNISKEIVIVDGASTDTTRDIAQSYGAKIITAENFTNFHVNKAKAVDACTGDWILQIDADEEVSSQLSQEIQHILSFTDKELNLYSLDQRKHRLFLRHQKMIEERDHIKSITDGPVMGFYLPRRNYFLGKPLTYAGTYPDGVIRLFKNGKGHVPAKSVHEQIVVDGRISWLTHDLLHYSNPTLSRYFSGLEIYTTLLSSSIHPKTFTQQVITFFNYLFILPVYTFLRLFLRYKGILDGFHGFLFCLFSACHYPVAYVKYVKKNIFK